MDSGDSEPEMFITQTSPRRKRTFHTFDVLCEDTLAPDEDILALAGDVKEVEEQPCVTGFDRFAAPVSETEVRGKIEDCGPKSTKYKDKWAVALFENWREQRNMKVRSIEDSRVDGRQSGLEVIESSIEMMSDDELNRTLASFICEIRKTDGSKYPPNTLYGIIVVGILLYLLLNIRKLLNCNIITNVVCITLTRCSTKTIWCIRNFVSYSERSIFYLLNDTFLTPNGHKLSIHETKRKCWPKSHIFTSESN